MHRSPATQLEQDLWRLDLNFQGEAGVIAAYLLTDPSGHTLIETGPGSTLGALDESIAAAGARTEEITRLVVTHIHLDHAGAAGSLLRRLPEARLYVHPLGAVHMINPERLLKSATRIYGDRMDLLWGAFEPCPTDRVIDVDDGAEIPCGRRTLVALHTPGHAWHHIAYHDPVSGSLFTGDVAGVRIPGAHLVRPPTPPPDIDLDAWHESIARMRALRPNHLELTHFGRFDDVDRHFDELEQRLDQWVAWVRERLDSGRSSEDVARELKEKSVADVVLDVGDDSLATSYELASPSGMTVDGIQRYLMQKYPRP
jgi:glyoxylase-like metal-dependent hydrolase (beta-lactamase superfamily II)